MNCDHSKTYRSMYKAYTNGTNPSGYAADVFEKNCINKPDNSCINKGICTNENKCCSDECIRKLNDIMGECNPLLPQNYNFNTLNETTDNDLITLDRPPLISCKDGSKEGDKIYCPPMDKYIDANVFENKCKMYKQCNCKDSKNCRECVKANCVKNYECAPLCLSRAGGLMIKNKSACERCKQSIKSS